MKNYVLTALITATMLWIRTSQALNVEVDINRGLNNNVFLESDDILRNANDGMDQKSDDIQTQFGLMVAHEFLDQSNSDASIILDYFQESFEENDLETQIFTFSLPYSYYMGEYRFRSTYSQSRYELASQEILLYNTGRFELTKRLGDNRLGARVSMTNKTPKDERYEGYKGNSADLKLYLQLRRVDHRIQLDIDIFNNYYSDEFIATQGYYLQTSFNQHYTGHSWRLAARYKNTQYNEDPLYDEIRNDQQYSLNYGHNFYIYDQVDLYVSSEYTTHLSNISDSDDNFNYNQWINSVGVRLSF